MTKDDSLKPDKKTCPTCGAVWTFTPWDSGTGAILVEPKPKLCDECEARLAKVLNSITKVTILGEQLPSPWANTSRIDSFLVDDGLIGYIKKESDGTTVYLNNFTPGSTFELRKVDQE